MTASAIPKSCLVASPLVILLSAIKKVNYPAVGDIMFKTCEYFSIRDNLCDSFIQALLSLYSVDVDGYRDDDEGVDWDQVSGGAKELM